MGKAPSDDVSAPLTWQQYSTALGSFGSSLSLVVDGRCPRKIVMLEAGTLYCRDYSGNLRPLTGLWQGFEHPGQVSAIEPQQTAAFVAYW